MKRLLLACILLAALALPASAAGDLPIRIAGSLDLGNWWSSGVGISAHLAYTPMIVDGILRVGGGATFELPLGDVSQLAIYATGIWFPVPTFVKNKKAEWYDKWYVRANLGFNIPVISDYPDSKGGFYSGWGTGYEVTKAFFLEVLYGHYAWNYSGWLGAYINGYTVIHLTFGFKI